MLGGSPARSRKIRSDLLIGPCSRLTIAVWSWCLIPSPLDLPRVEEDVYSVLAHRTAAGIVFLAQLRRQPHKTTTCAGVTTPAHYPPSGKAHFRFFFVSASGVTARQIVHAPPRTGVSVSTAASSLVESYVRGLEKSTEVKKLCTTKRGQYSPNA